MNRILSNIAPVFALIGILSAGSSMPAVAAAHPSIDIVASNWKFTPDTIELHVGQPTTLRVTSSEGVHGLKSDELGIAETTIMPGQYSKVDVTPSKAGTYVLHCSIVCGAGHSNMILTVHVLP